MLFDPPARFLYRHHVNMYGPMRLFACNYRYLTCLAVVVVVAWMARVVLTSPSVLAKLGIIAPTLPH